MMLLQIYFEVAPEMAQDFEAMFNEVYVPAMRVQQGYVGSKLLRLFPSEVAEEIQAAPTAFNYQMELMFDTEENRRRWAASEQHQVAWPKASGMARDVAWRGYDVAVDDAL